MKRQIYSSMDMERRVLEMGFLPFFTCGIPGFSIEEMTDKSLIKLIDAGSTKGSFRHNR